MRNFLLGLILVSPAIFAADDNILITDIAIKEGNQVIVFIDDIGRYVTVARENDVKIVFDADDVLPGKHTAVIKIIDRKLQTITETSKEIEVKE